MSGSSLNVGAPTGSGVGIGDAQGFAALLDLLQGKPVTFSGITI